jgi:hypothetical protein
MKSNLLKKKVIILRKQGLLYREIMKEIPVAKATITRWLHEAGLANYQTQEITDKRRAAMQRGHEATRQKRILKTQKIMNEAGDEIHRISQREFWLMGVMLYWAEGSKEKEYDPGCGIKFNNTDPTMIRFFLEWLRVIFDKTLKDITIDIYIHDIQRHRTKEIIDFWTETIRCPKNYLQHVYYKKGNPKTLRKNTGENYHGTIRINVKASSTLNRRIAGWTQGVVKSTRQ